MNRTEANLSLFIITFFAAVQYRFLANVPDTVSYFAFLCITNFIGFLIMFFFFFGELFRLDKKQVIQTFVLSALLFGFNVFILFGASGLEATVSACVLSAYFVFIPLLSFVFFRAKTEKNCYVGIAVVLIGLFLMMNADIGGLLHMEILYLVIADVFFAMYILTAGRYSLSSNPSILAIGQMFFNFIFALFFWIGESAITKTGIDIPTDSSFWESVIYISFFVRGLYGIIQIYAQRYVSPLNTSLIFSTEIIMTMAVSPIFTAFFGTEPEKITLLRVVGAFVMVFGILAADSHIVKAINNKIAKKNNLINFISGMFKAIKESFIREKNTFFVKQIFIVFFSAVIYICADLPVQMTGFLNFPSIIGIKNFLPVTIGLFMGPYGIIGECAGCAVSAVVMDTAVNYAVLECICIFIMGIGMWLGWHSVSKTHRIELKNRSHYRTYISMLIFFSCLCGAFSIIFIGTGVFLSVFISYLFFGLLIGIPVNILLGSLLCIENIIPFWCSKKNHAEFIIDKSNESLINANEILEESALTYKLGMKRIFEIQNCLEELSIRVFKILPEIKIQVKVLYGNATSVRFNYSGIKYNPLLFRKDDDEIDIVSLKLIRHYALRASYRYKNKENHIHIVL